MSLESAVRRGVALADRITANGGLQAWVWHTPCVGEDGRGGRTYGRKVKRRAVVDTTRGRTKNAAGELVDTVATVVFPRPIAATKAEPGGERVNPIDPRDLLVLSDGTSGPIVRTDSPIDGATGKPYITQVWLGK